jgi:gamma-glutamyl-gamma-aminobutyrate hydrolase PuuD
MRIAISQRSDEVSSYRERRDALDQRWAQRLESLGLISVPVPNGLQDPQAWARALGIQGLLMTGGNDLCGLQEARHEAPERDRSEGLLLDLAYAEQWPVLGVCRGMQMLNMYLGGKVIPVARHVAVRHGLLRTIGQGVRLLATMPHDVEVNSFHSFGIAADGLAQTLLPVLYDAQGFIEAAEHQHLPWAAIMWHPEREPVLGNMDRILFSTIFKHHD